MTTAERIKLRRKELGLRAEDVAEKIGVSRSTMFRYENGGIEKLPINNLAEIARVLSTSVEYLMGWDSAEDILAGNEKEPALANKSGLDMEIIELILSLPEGKKTEAVNYLRYLAERAEK